MQLSQIVSVCSSKDSCTSDRHEVHSQYRGVSIHARIARRCTYKQ